MQELGLRAATHLLTVLTWDRRGIVAAISATLAELDVELMELSQTVIHDYFTITLVVAIPDSSGLDQTLAESVRRRVGEGAAVTLVPFHARAAERAGDRYVLTAGGEGSASVIHSISELVAERGGNFLELNCQYKDGRVAIVAEIDLPGDVALDQLQIDLQHAGEAAGVQVRLQHQRLFTATNEIAFRRVASQEGAL